jgi:hypothetical protein
MKAGIDMGREYSTHGEKRNVCNMLVGYIIFWKVRWKDTTEETDVGERIILRWILRR